MYVISFKSTGIRDIKLWFKRIIYHSINGTPACANKYLLTEILRNEWGYKGSVISDNNGVENIYSGHHYVNDTYHVSTGALSMRGHLILRTTLSICEDKQVYY